LGIVYATDAAVEDNVTVIGTFPEGSHDADRLSGGDHRAEREPGRRGLPRLLTSDTARAIWQEFGFSVLD
jgi:molybdate transport system substrate-binding protein